MTHTFGNYEIIRYFLLWSLYSRVLHYQLHFLFLDFYYLILFNVSHGNYMIDSKNIFISIKKYFCFRMRGLALLAVVSVCMGQKAARIGPDGKPLLNRPDLAECMKRKSSFAHTRQISFLSLHQFNYQLSHSILMQVNHI